MELLYLGTAAAEGIPAVFCSCESCVRSLRLGGRNIRSRSQALVDGRLLIDFPCDSYYRSLVRGVNLSKIQHCLITHIHPDHFYPTELKYLAKNYSQPSQGYRLCIYGSEDLREPLQPLIADSRGFLEYRQVAPFEPFRIEQYTISALRAYHGTENPLVYLISDPNSCLLYAHDTDIFGEQSWEYLRSTGRHIDAVSLDCTHGAAPAGEWHGHQCLQQNVQFRERLLEYGLADRRTRFVLNHFSHNGTQCVYDDFVPIAAELGFEVSYDGMLLQIGSALNY